MTDHDTTESEAGGTAVLEPPPVREAEEFEQRKKPPKAPRYHVILWDDQDHTYEYVMEMVQTLFGKSKEEAFEIAQTVDREGRVIVLTTALEVAELKRDQIHGYGKDFRLSRCAGAMSASIEPAPE